MPPLPHDNRHCFLPMNSVLGTLCKYNCICPPGDWLSSFSMIHVLAHVYEALESELGALCQLGKSSTAYNTAHCFSFQRPSDSLLYSYTTFSFPSLNVEYLTYF